MSRLLMCKLQTGNEMLSPLHILFLAVVIVLLVYLLNGRLR
jgi:hypothetical protein